MKRSRRKPECPEECLKATYLPTISFSALSPESFPTESDTTNEKVPVLKEKLTSTREIAYRVDPEKMSTSSRYLHTVKENLHGVLSLLDGVERHLGDESLTINARLEDVSADCFWLSGKNV